MVNSLTFGLRAYQVWYYGSFSRPLPGARGRRIPEGLKGAITPSFVVQGGREEGDGRPVNAPSWTNFRVFGDPRLSRKPNERRRRAVTRIRTWRQSRGCRATFDNPPETIAPVSSATASLARENVICEVSNEFYERGFLARNGCWILPSRHFISPNFLRNVHFLAWKIFFCSTYGIRHRYSFDIRCRVYSGPSTRHQHDARGTPSDRSGQLGNAEIAGSQEEFSLSGRYTEVKCSLVW